MNDTREYILDRITQNIEEPKAENVEKSIYNYTIDFCNKNGIDIAWENMLFSHIYKQKSLDVLRILADVSIIQKIKDKTIKAKDIAFLKHEDLYPNEAVDNINEEVSEGLFECRNCGSKKTTYYSLQTRSADEPMTNFVTCVVCKNRWKM